MLVFTIFIAVVLCWITVYHLLQLRKLKLELQEWGSLSPEEESNKARHTKQALIWGLLYILSLLATVIMSCDF